MVSRMLLTMGAVVISIAAGPVSTRAADAPGAGASRPAVAPGVVDGPTAHQLVAGGIKVVDVRTPEEFAQGHVPGAINIPYDQMEKRHAEIGPPSTPVLLYCRTGRRSGIAAKTLRDAGFATIYDLQAYDRWVASEPAR